MTAAARTEPTPGTAVATQSTTSERIEGTRAVLKERNALVAAIRGTQWGRDTTPDMARAVAHYCYENGLDPVRHVEILGGRIYLTAEFYDEKGAHLIRAGIVRPEEPVFIHADDRLDKLAGAGDEWAVAELTRRTRLRIQHAVPEGVKAAVIQRFQVFGGAMILGVNWVGGTSKKDPVGEAEPTKTALTRARRRAWKQIADVVPGYGEIVKPLEATAKIASEALPVSVVDVPEPQTKPLIGSGYDDGSSREVVSEEPPCPKCGGRVWDNRMTKRDGKAADFRCRDPKCDGAIFPPKDGEARDATGTRLSA